MKTLTKLALLSATLFTTPAFALSSGGYSLTTSQGVEDRNGYVRMRHNTQYEICLSNNTGTRSDAVVKVDGLDVGEFRLEAWQSYCIDRPVNDHGQFTFYKTNTYEGHLSGLPGVNAQVRGVVSATFYPEQRHYYHRPHPRHKQHGGYGHKSGRYPLETYPSQGQFQTYDFESAPSSNAAPAISQHSLPQISPQISPRSGRITSGGTGLSGQSNQWYQDVHDIIRDHSRAVTLELRLVHDTQQEYSTYYGPRPLPGRYPYYQPQPYIIQAPGPVRY